MKEQRQGEREAAFKDVEDAREGYKENVNEIMDGRNKYRESIEGRKVKEATLIDMISQDKADIA